MACCAASRRRTIRTAAAAVFLAVAAIALSGVGALADPAADSTAPLAPSGIVTVADEPRPRAGLMWNRTGLPAIFPLVVRTLPGRDFFMVLTERATGTPALAAYVRGGAFFRVLVPPGTYDVTFAHGTGWRGEDALFGPGRETGIYRLDRPLSFEVVGLSRKQGHLIDLSRVFAEGEVSAMHRPLSICQRVVDRPARHIGARGAVFGRTSFGGPPRHRPGDVSRAVVQDVLSRVCGPRPG